MVAADCKVICLESGYLKSQRPLFTANKIGFQSLYLISQNPDAYHATVQSSFGSVHLSSGTILQMLVQRLKALLIAPHSDPSI